jgi:hypothetical protein
MPGFPAVFPGGAAGIGLALLRCIVAILVIATWHAADLQWPVIQTGAAALVVAFLALGACTPITVLVCVLHLCGISTGSQGSLQLTISIAILIAIAAALLGPGAYSVDARLFGPRIVAVHGVDTSAPGPRDGN